MRIIRIKLKQIVCNEWDECHENEITVVIWNCFYSKQKYDRHLADWNDGRENIFPENG